MPPAKIKQNNQSGFSIIEAIVVLLIGGMILSLILPIASRSTADNLRIGMRGLDNFSVSISEQLFRRLASAVVPPDARPFEPAPTNTVSGTPQEARFSVRSPDAVFCAPEGQTTNIVLKIEPQGDGGRLVCEALSRQVEVLQWASGAGQFAYSPDGSRWIQRWPESDRPAGVPTLTSADIDNIKSASVSAPLLRFQVKDGPETVSWIVSMGRAQPVESRIEDFYRQRTDAFTGADIP